MEGRYSLLVPRHGVTKGAVYVLKGCVPMEGRCA